MGEKLLSSLFLGMERTGIVSIIIIFVNLIVTYKGLKDYSYLRRYALDVPHILITKEYQRLLTSGFLHSTWTHFIFNMIVLYSFGTSLESFIGMAQFVLIYFSSLILSNGLSILIHRNKSSYVAVGASGAISGVIFSLIALFPQMKMGLLFIPGVRISGWIFGLLYMLYCMFGMRSQRDNIGHDAHLTGGLTGVLITLAIYPESLLYNYLTIALIVLPSLIFLFLVLTRPGFLLIERPFAKAEGTLTVEDKYNSSKRSKELELDKLLDKISREGINSLSKKEKERLEQLSKVRE